VPAHMNPVKLRPLPLLIVSRAFSVPSDRGFAYVIAFFGSPSMFSHPFSSGPKPPPHIDPIAVLRFPLLSNYATPRYLTRDSLPPTTGDEISPSGAFLLRVQHPPSMNASPYGPILEFPSVSYSPLLNMISILYFVAGSSFLPISFEISSPLVAGTFHFVPFVVFIVQPPPFLWVASGDFFE